MVTNRDVPHGTEINWVDTFCGAASLNSRQSNSFRWGWEDVHSITLPGNLSNTHRLTRNPRSQLQANPAKVMEWREVKWKETKSYFTSYRSRPPGLLVSVVRTHLLLLTSPYAYFPNLIRTHFFCRLYTTTFPVMDSSTREKAMYTCYVLWTCCVVVKVENIQNI